MACHLRLSGASGFRWKRVTLGEWDLHFTGALVEVRSFAMHLAKCRLPQDIGHIESMLCAQRENGAFIAVSRSCVIAAVDMIQSYPIYFLMDGSETAISNSARMLVPNPSVGVVRSDALTEFKMAGYVTGGDTLVPELHQLQAGEMLVVSGPQWQPEVHRYFRYVPTPDTSVEPDVYLQRLGEVTEAIFRRMIDRAGGRQLLVPLSGGLDSRLIVTMLRHLGYENVRTFSYGPAGNFEARIARRVAEAVGYEWEFIPTTHRGYKEFFWSDARKAYWQFADGLCTVPNMQDIVPLLAMKARGLPEDSIVVNGQSGDFISGGHVPVRLVADGTKVDLTNLLLDKHFALRKSLRTPENEAAVSARMAKSFDQIEAHMGGPVRSAALYESWEWQERQCKYVVAGQRIYDWMGLDWALPLWAPEYLSFWRDVPFELKSGQALYKRYLQSSNYCNMFRDFNPTVWRWPGAAVAVLPVAQVIGLLAGRRTKDRFYEYARYFGHYGPSYAPWGLGHFLREAPDIRNAIPCLIDTWLTERELDSNSSKNSSLKVTNG